jgi:PAS domain S-box-containing protein
LSVSPGSDPSGRELGTKPVTSDLDVQNSDSTEELVSTAAPFFICDPAPDAFLKWLKEARREIVEEWVDRLSPLSGSYRQRPREELVGTVCKAFEANLDFLSRGELARINQFIDYITQLRLESGFPLSDVQGAFELFRFVVVRRLKEQGRFKLLALTTDSLNSCLAHTIHRFSDRFQHMHERSIRDHACNLEHEIAVRTNELSESERRYKTLVEEINDGYFVIHDERILFANQAFCRMHGTTLEKTLGQPFLHFVAPEWRDRLREAYLGSSTAPLATSTIEYARIGSAPENSATEVKGRVADLGQGPVIIGICRDISERVAMERKIRETEHLAYVGHLTASLSHELRNPLSSIKMNLQILSRKMELDAFDRRRMEIVVQEVSRLECILRQLLDITRPVKVDLAVVDVKELVRGCVVLMEPRANESRLEIVRRHSRALCPVMLDGDKVQQALINLLLNAIDVSPEGARITVFAKIANKQENRYLELGVKDNGPGIEPDMIPHLFAPFVTSKAHGAGLGLSNVKRIAEAHGGTIEVASRKGRGASFTMRLPWKI